MMYGINIRRELHMHPEVGFDLPYTLSVVRRELSRFGIPFTEKYCKSSIVATINANSPKKALAIRADMDALPIIEVNDVPYKSLYEGKMHACGHDVHTAILLDMARKLLENKYKLTRPIKLIFQSAEEGGGGGRLMVNDGVLDEVEEIIAIHVNTTEVGNAQFIYGPSNSACAHLKIEFFGTSAHSAMQEHGADAILMAVQALSAIENYIAKRIPACTPVLFNAGTIEGGTASNIIAQYCSVNCHVRSWDDTVLDKLLDAIDDIVESTARILGGKGTVQNSGTTPVLVHDNKVTDHIRLAAEQVLGKEHVYEMTRAMASEDFAVFAQQCPASMLRLGAGNKQKGITSPVHTNSFDVDERCINLGSEIYVAYLKNRMIFEA